MPNPEEFRRTRRVIDLLIRIANQPRRWTRRALAERYEVSEKQIDKDLFLIRHGLLMDLRHTPQGYYFERIGSLPALTLSLPEALALLLAARLGQQMPGVSSSDLAAALARVESLLPAELLPLAGTLARNGGDGEEARAATLRELQTAIAELAQLRLLYRSASRPGPPTERTVDPYTLLPYQRSWYLVAYCHERGAVRIFKADRIARISRTGERFEYPADFDLTGYMGPTWGLLRGEAGEPEEVELEFEPDTGRWLRDQELHESQRVEDLPDGRLRLTLHAGITPELRRWVFGFGRQVRVVRPAHLAAWVLEEARGMVGEMAGTGEQENGSGDDQ